MSLLTHEVSYSRLMIVCDRCQLRLLRRGWFTTWLRAEEWAKEKGWFVADIGPNTDLLTGGTHLCPACKEIG